MPGAANWDEATGGPSSGHLKELCSSCIVHLSVLRWQYPAQCIYARYWYLSIVELFNVIRIRTSISVHRAHSYQYYSYKVAEINNNDNPKNQQLFLLSNFTAARR